MKRYLFYALLLALLASTPFEMSAQKGKKTKKTTKVSTKGAQTNTPNKAWATYCNGVLTFSYGSKPQPPVQVDCAGCGKKMPFKINSCSNCGAKNEKDFVVYDALARIPYPYLSGYTCGPWFEKSETTKKVVFISSFKQVTNITNIAYWFDSMYNLTEIIGLEYLNTAKVTDMSNLFYGCHKLKYIDLTHFDTSSVIEMYGMFCGCESITSLDLSQFKTDNVTRMSGMFCGIKCKKLDLSSFNTSNVKSMRQMFQACDNLISLDLSNFNTSKVEDMHWMFNDCENLVSLNVSSFNTSNVRNMEGMFGRCKSLTTLDLTSFDTRNAIANHMFEDSWNLKTIYVTDVIWQPKVNTSTYHPYVMESCNAKIIKK